MKRHLASPREENKAHGRIGRVDRHESTRFGSLAAYDPEAGRVIPSSVARQEARLEGVQIRADNRKNQRLGMK